MQDDNYIHYKQKNIGSEVMPRTFTIGKETIELPPMEEESEIKERIAYEKTLADTNDYKAFRAKGLSHKEAIWATQNALNIAPKPPYKDETGKELKWFSISRLTPELRIKAKKYWK